VDRPPVIAAQQGAASQPSATTLADAVLWDYSFTCYYAEGVPFTVTFNEERTVSYTYTGGTSIEPGGDDAPVVTASSESGDVTIAFRNLNAIDVQSARVAFADVAMIDACTPNIDNAQQIEIGGTSATLAEQLTSLLKTLLGNSPFASQPMRMECHYGYSIGGVSVQAPVLLVARQDVPIGFDEEFIRQMTAAIDQWLEAVQPPSTDARLIFGLTLWSAVPHIDATLLRLASVSLPMSGVSRA